MKKTTIIILIILVFVVLGVILILSGTIRFNFMDEKNSDLEKSENNSVKIHLSCSEGYSAVALYYLPNERGIMEKLSLDMTKDGKREHYDMIPSVSGSGAKFATKDGIYYFWEHQGEFSFAKNDENIAICHKEN